MESILRVSAQSHPRVVAELIVAGLKNDRRVVLQAIGMQAVYQAVKASATAHNTLQPSEIVSMVTDFVDVEIEGNIRTAIRFVLRLERFSL